MPRDHLGRMRSSESHKPWPCAFFGWGKPCVTRSLLSHSQVHYDHYVPTMIL
jgi:hypothetical protein